MERRQRVIGRISDRIWGKLKLAAAAQSQSFSEWAERILLEAAARGAPGRDIDLGGRHLPPRQIGRMDDSSWDTLKRAAETAGRSFSVWAVSILVDAAEAQR